MSYLNINYSTLEDAWGENFEKKKKKKTPPACELVSNRNANVYKPYKTLHESSHIKPIYTDKDYIKYHGYQDGRPVARDNKKLSKYKLQYPYKPKSNYFSEEEDFEEEDFEEEETYVNQFSPIKPRVKSQQFAYYKPKVVRNNYSGKVQNGKVTLNKKVHPQFKTQKEIPRKLNVKPLVQPDEEDEEFELINNNNDDVSDDEFDSYLTPKNSEEEDDETIDDEYNNILRSVYTEEESPRKKRYALEEEDFEEEDYPIRKRKTVKSLNNINLDLVLYTVSGIILIFILEQFIQIGMKIKTV
jgi:hypothetical protein